MQVIEFNAIAQHHRIQLPPIVPDGVTVHVALSWEPVATPTPDLKQLFASVTDGLSDEDLKRPHDLGREAPEWGI